MTENLWQSVATGVFGLAGVVVGGSMQAVREWLADRRRRHYHAVRVVCTLDKFVADCAAAVGQERQAEENPLSPWPQDLEFPADIDWRLLDENLVYRALTLPSRVVGAASVVSFAGEWAVDERDPEYLGAVSQQYTPLGIDAAELADKLRRSCRLPPRDVDRWDPVARLREQAEKIAR